MSRIILTYGLIAGLVIIVVNTINMELGHGQVWLGFLVMFIAFSAIFFAIRQYRDQVLGGVITFWNALLMGFGIAAVAAIIYVTGWELYLAYTDYGFIETYANAMIEARRAAGASDADMARTIAASEEFRQQYANPLIRLPMTLLEILPVGLLVSLVSALVLRNHKTVRKTN